MFSNKTSNFITMNNYNYFKSNKANKNFNFWINQSPESFHPLDVERFNEMV